MNTPSPDTSGRRGRPERSLAAPTTALERFGTLLRQIRHDNALTQTELARQAQRSVSVISQAENSRLRLGADLVEHLDQILHADGTLIELHQLVLHEQQALRRRHRSLHPADTSPYPLPGDLSQWIGDVSIPDGMLMAPNEPFRKTWRLRNAGTVPWIGRHLLRLGAPSSLTQIRTPRLTPIPDTAPGELVDITVECIAQAVPGTSVAHFKFADDDGRLYYPLTNFNGITTSVTVLEGRRPRPH